MSIVGQVQSWKGVIHVWKYYCFHVFPLSKVLQHILNPAFLHSFEKGEGEQLLGPPNPEGDNPDSITSVFITKVHTCFQTSSETASVSADSFSDSYYSAAKFKCVFCCLCSLIRSTICIFCHYDLHPIQSDLLFPISAAHYITACSNCQLQLSPFFIVSSICPCFYLPPAIPLIPLSITFHSSDQTLIPGVNVRVRPC